MSDDDLITYKCYHAGLEKWFDPEGSSTWIDLEPVKKVKLQDKEECLTSLLTHFARDLDAVDGVWIVPCMLGSVSEDGLIDLEPDFIVGYMIDSELDSGLHA